MGKRKAAKAGLTNPPLQKKLFDGDPTKHLAPTSTPYGAVEVQIRSALAGKASQHETAPLYTSDVVSLDVGGTLFKTTWDTLLWHKDSYFGGFRHDFKKEDTIFIDRDPKHFRIILNFLRSKRAILDGLSIAELKELSVELDFYGMEEFEQVVDNRVKSLLVPHKLQVSGRADGKSNTTMNGTYFKGASLHQGRVYYQNPDTGWVIRWYPSSLKWMFDMDGLKNDNITNAVVQQDVLHPGLVTSFWHIYSSEQATFEKDENVQIIAEY